MASGMLGLDLSSTALIKTGHNQLEARDIRCSFCGLGEGQVARLFEGRNRYICNECVRVCSILMTDYKLMGYAPPWQRAPWYRRILGAQPRNVIHCSFCGTERAKGEYLMASPESQICERCVHACESINYDAYPSV